MSRVLREVGIHAGLAAAVALAWVLLFALNDLIFSRFEVNTNVNWIFLPAAIRMVAVVWVGWAGALGLFIGGLATNIPLLQSDPAAALTLAALSSLPSLLAATAVAAWLRLPLDLAGLRPGHLLVFGVAGAAASVAAHTAYFVLRSGDVGVAAHAFAMFVGDALGTVLVLLLIATLLRKPTSARQA